LLLGDPENAELSEMYNSLAEVIALTEDLLKDARQQHEAASAAAGTAAPSASAVAPAVAGTSAASTSLPVAQIVTPPALNLPSILPASVAEQIRKAQVRAALLGQASAAWAIGAPCQAIYSADGQFYNAVVEGVSASGNFIVVYEGYEEKEEVPPASVRPPPEATEIYKGVAAPKRKRVEEQPVVTEIPKWLEIKDTDDEKTKARKRKLLKSYKSKIRFQEMDVAQKEKQDSWQSFLTGKGGKKKAGFFTGRKKESMFKVPEGASGKVGVIGSGKGITEYAKRGRHEFELTED